ncbi:MAG: hypothetical protein KGR46_04345 [Verrucomicrobia bacterium]|nr:hypothetical protein [Verrucomicrobiota bacterium]
MLARDRVLGLAAAVVFFGAGGAFPQQQERTLLERIDRPDTTLASPMQGKAFVGGGGAELGKSAAVREFPGAGKKAALGEFGGTRSFFGIKNPWFGERTFETGQAAMVRDARVSKDFATRDARVGEFAAAERSAKLGGSGSPVRPFLVRGEAQGALDGISDKVKKEMTIDEVRELLNKPR